MLQAEMARPEAVTCTKSAEDPQIVAESHLDCRAIRGEGLDRGRVTDMRCGMNSLALKGQEGLGRDPHGGEMFCFRARKGDLIKVLWHDGVFEAAGSGKVHLACQPKRVCRAGIVGATGLSSGRTVERIRIQHRLIYASFRSSCDYLQARDSGSCVRGQHMAVTGKACSKESR